jgi:hypothetical protein
MQVEELIGIATGQQQRPVEHHQEQEGDAGKHHQRPCRARIEERCPERYLQDVEQHEGIGRAAAEIKLDGQGCHVEHQFHEQPDIRDGRVLAQPGQRRTIEKDQQQHDCRHRLQREWDANAVVHNQDGRHLADHRQPAQLHQQHEILAIGHFHGRHPSGSSSPRSAFGRVSSHSPPDVPPSGGRSALSSLRRHSCSTYQAAASAIPISVNHVIA